jgi:hypothetical protein
MILIAGLSLKDLCMGAFVEPVYATWLITAQRADSFELFCSMGMICKSMLFGLMAVTGFNVTAISVDRCLAVRSRANYRTLVTIKRVTRFLIFAWIASFVIVFPLTFESKTNAFRAVAVLGGIFFIVSKTSYILSIKTLRKLQSQVSPAAPRQKTAEEQSFNISKYSRSLRTLFIVVCFDVLFYCPFISIGIIRGAGIKLSEKNWAIYLSVCELLMMLPSSVNPCILLCRIQDLRQEAKAKVKCLLRVGGT